jgi:phage shock protein PspC (stress-responsive transcriptional regulator)
MTDHTEQPPPPSTASPFAARYGLVRPLQGRYLAGVCAALGRATGTDPVLWRVILAVLICFGGVGVLIYLALWLVTPEEGDTASPVEALLGRGWSSTSPVLAVLLLVLAGLVLLGIAPRPVYLMLLGGAVALAVLLLVQRASAGGQAGRPTGAAPAGGPAAATGDPTPATGDPTPATGDPTPLTGPVSAASAGGPVPTTGPVPAASTAPFAPYGPFTTSPPPPPPPPKPPKPPKAPREPSALAPVTFFTLLVVVGLLGALDLAGVLAVPPAGYVAAALGVVGAGMLVGAWLGRGRPLIALGLVLAVALPVADAFDRWDRPQHIGAEVSWTPADVTELQDSYEVAFGEGVLDLRQVDFQGRQARTAVRVSFGEIRVLLPPEVALTADTRVSFGAADLLGQHHGGLRTVTTVVHPGQPGGGTLQLDLSIAFGNLEVQR